METITYIALTIIGAAMGSFSGATIWRLRAKDLNKQKANHESVSKKELEKLEPLSKSSIKDDRSICLHCKHRLSALDMIPIISWISLGGKCRYCRKPIGKFEITMEILTAGFFVLSYYFWPYAINSAPEIIKFLLWLVIGVGLIIIGGYDSKWSEIPALLMYVIIGLSAVWAIIRLAENNFSSSAILSLIISVVILSGLYLAIFLVSKGKWIGFGDVELGLALGLLLGEWTLAFVAIFAANLIGTIMVLPGLISKKLSRNQPVPFGPLFIAGFFLAFIYGDQIAASLLYL
jgi:prepilin signal peptidase PulO-like enzyme (type II secretory pathway)